MIEKTRPQITRSRIAASSPPVRILHLGLGAFHRAHQAWYTSRAEDAADWGIAAFSGRSGSLPDLLAPQGGVFTLVERGAEEDLYEHVTSIVDARAATDRDAYMHYASAPTTAIITLTVTEAGYSLTPTGMPDLNDPLIVRDIGELQRAIISDTLETASPQTTLGRLLLGLEGRRRSGAPAVAIVPCDNIPANGSVLAQALATLANLISPDLAGWLPTGASFVSTSVDRITPRATDDLLDAVQSATGWYDAAPVATEPFSDWTLSGEFPSGRPQWESAGARFVADIGPYESRKLWMLNGAHTLLAASGRLRGHRAVAEAMLDDQCLGHVEAWWDEASHHLAEELDVPAYRDALLERFANPRIEHSLTQIATDSATKLGVRVAPVARLELAAGRGADAAATAIAAWIASLQLTPQVPDERADDISVAEQSAEPIRELLAIVAPDLATDETFSRRVSDAVDGLTQIL